jgi:hypothetical protein
MRVLMTSFTLTVRPEVLTVLLITFRNIDFKHMFPIPLNVMFQSLLRGPKFLMSVRTLFQLAFLASRKLNDLTVVWTPLARHSSLLSKPLIKLKAALHVTRFQT